MGYDYPQQQITLHSREGARGQALDWIEVPEGYGRILLMNIYPGMPPYTETDGSATIRIGKDCMPLTGSMRKEIFTAFIPLPWKE